MGQPVSVIEKPTSNPSIVCFETNRVLSGMGHESYRSSADVTGSRPTDVVARRLFAAGGVAAVHVNGNVITVHLDRNKRFDASGLLEIIEGLYTYYVPGVEPPSDEELMTEAG